MTSKRIPENTIEMIKEWIKCDNEMRQLQKELNQCKIEKKEKTAGIIQAMKTYDIDCFAVKDGNIQYKQKSKKKPLPLGHILKLLLEYHGGNEEKALELQEFLKSGREEVVCEEIVRRKN